MGRQLLAAKAVFIARAERNWEEEEGRKTPVEGHKTLPKLQQRSCSAFIVLHRKSAPGRGCAKAKL